MNKELKNDLIACLGEVNEAIENIRRGNLREVDTRLVNAKYWLHKYVSELDVMEEKLSG